MESDKLNEYMAAATSMLKDNTIDQKTYDEIEDFILKNSSRLAADPCFAALENTMADIARKAGRRDISSLREGFGLNSCAQ